MKLSVIIQESLVALLAYGEDLAQVRIIKQIVPLRCYDPYYFEIAEELVAYIDRYDEVADDHLLDLVEKLCEARPDNEKFYRHIYDSMQETRRGINVEYVVDQARSFARYQNLRSGIGKALDALEEETDEGLERADSELQKAMERGLDLFDAGTLLSDTSRSLRFLDLDRTSFPCGVPAIDRVGLGPARKRLHVFVALPGRGKSWWLVHLAKQAILSRLRVLYITLELDEPEVCQRIYQSLFSVSKRKEDVERMKLETDELGRFVSFEETTISTRPALSDPDIRSKLAERAKRALAKRPPLVVKEFPAGSLTIEGLEAYLDSLQAHHDFIPDLIALDYADEMKTSSENYRLDLGNLYKMLRGVAQKRNLAIATASQANRSAERARIIDREHIGEDFSKIARADTVLTYTQTPAEAHFGLARLYVAKGRTDKDRFSVLISQAYALGQFCLDSASMVSSYWDTLDEQAVDFTGPEQD